MTDRESNIETSPPLSPFEEVPHTPSQTSSFSNQANIKRESLDTESKGNIYQSNTTHSAESIKISGLKHAVKVKNPDGTTGTSSIPLTFYSQISILGTITEPKFKLDKNKFTEFKNELINHARKYGYLSYIEKPTTITWINITKRYPSAINASMIYIQFREEMEKIYALLIDLIKEHYPNMDSIETRLRDDYFKSLNYSQDQIRNYVDEVDKTYDNLLEYTGSYHKGNPNLLWKFITSSFETITESAYGFISIINEICTLKYNYPTETAHQFIQRFEHLITRLNKILAIEQPRVGQVLPDTIKSAIVINSLPKQFTNLQPLLLNSEKIEPEFIYKHLIKRDEVESTTKFKPTSKDENAYYSSSSNPHPNYNSDNGNQQRQKQNNYAGNPKKRQFNKPPQANFNPNRSQFVTNTQHHSLIATFAAGGAVGNEIDYADNYQQPEGYENNPNETGYESTGEESISSNFQESEPDIVHSMLAIDDIPETLCDLVDEGILDETDVALAARENEHSFFDLESVKPYTLILDSGSTKHICYNQRLLTKTQQPVHPYRITGLYGAKNAVSLIGTLQITDKVNLTNVCYLPSAGANLVSISAICQHGYGVWFNQYTATVYKQGQRTNVEARPIMQFVHRRGLYVLILKGSKNMALAHSGLQVLKDQGILNKSTISAPATKPAERRKIPKKSNTLTTSTIPGGVFTNNKIASNPMTFSSNARQQLSTAREQNKQLDKNANVSNSNSSHLAYYESDNSFLAISNNDTKLYDLHQQLGHITLTKPILATLGINIDKDPIINCDTCNQVKLVRNKTGTGTFNDRKPNSIFERIDVDLVGPLSLTNPITKTRERVKTNGGREYILNIIDHYSRYGFTRLLHMKSDAPEELIKVMNFIRNQFNVNIKILFSDGGKEFINSTVTEYLDKHGIQRMYPPSNSPSLNGMVERYNGTLLTTMRSLLVNVNAKPSLWGEAAITASIIHNISPKKHLNYKSPYSIVHGREPDYTKLLIFGQDVQVLVNSNVAKLDTRTIVGSIMHYDETRLSYRILLPNDKIIYSRDIKPLNTFKCIAHNGNDNIDVKNQDNVITNIISGNNLNIAGINVLSTNNQSILQSGGVNQHDEVNLINHDNSHTSNEEIPPILPPIFHDETNEAQTRSSIMETIISDNISESEEDKEDDVYTPIPIQPLPAFHEGSTLTSRGRISIPTTRLNISNFNDQSYLADNIELFTSLNDDNIDIINPDISEIIDEPDPITMKDIMKSPNKDLWLRSMKSELNSLIENKVLMLTEKPINTKLLKTKWVYKLKRDHLNLPIKVKSRIVAKGYLQQQGVDYDEIFSPVVKHKSIKMLLALAAEFNLKIHQVDFTTAFLNAHLQEDLYIAIPSELNENNIDANKYCYKLNKALYGLRQSPLKWNRLLTDTLLELGYKQSEYDPCIFIKYIPGHDIPIIISVYVDDLLIFVKPELLRIWLNDKEIIKSKYKIDDIGEANYCLKMKINRLQNGLKIDQQGYIISLLEQFGMTKHKPLENPSMSLDMTDPNLFNNDELKLNESEHALYRSIIGSLIYLSNTTRIDITFATNLLARFSHCPTKRHLKAAKQILQYLIWTQDAGLIYTRSNEYEPCDSQSSSSSSSPSINLTCYCDSDHASDKLSRTSTSGFIIMLNNKPIHWISQRQRSIAQSSTEAEFISMNLACRELIWFKCLISEIFVNSNNTITIPTIFCDNGAAIIWATGEDINHFKSKHIDTRYKYVRAMVHDKQVVIKWKSTKYQLADLLTKGLSTERFDSLRTQLIR